MTHRVNPDILTLARESRGLTQNELAKRVGVNQSTLSKYEHDQLQVAADHLRAIAQVLEYPESIFASRETVYGFGSTCIYHRKRKTIPAGVLRQIHAKMNLGRMQLAKLLQGAEIESTDQIPRLDIDEFEGDVEAIADRVRRTWSLPLGPVKNLVAALEQAGGIVIPSWFGDGRLDAISHWPPTMCPLFFVNIDKPWDRIRFSLAHELGHLVMHRNPTANQEDEADRFASAFLMPRIEIKSQLRSLTLARLAELKLHWRVSMQALMRRALELDRISQWQYRRFFQKMSATGQRMSEPVVIQPEPPTVLARLVNVHLTDHGYTIAELSTIVGLLEGEFRAQYLAHDLGSLRLIKSD